jgi:hypothetical protein
MAWLLTFYLQPTADLVSAPEPAESWKASMSSGIWAEIVFLDINVISQDPKNPPVCFLLGDRKYKMK